MLAKDGRKIPIRRVRLEVSKTTFQVGSGSRARNVETKGNHHLAIYEMKDKKGNIKWDAEIVSQFEAMRRLRAGEPVVKRDRGEGSKFVYSLAGGECFEVTNEETGERERFVARTISGRTVWFVPINDARLKKDIINSGDFRAKSVDPLRKLDFKKIVVTPLGEVRYAND
jgi:hypothetical protein